MKQIVLTVAIPYEVEFIRRGCRKSEGLVVWDEGSIVIAEAAPSEMDVAFSIVPVAASGQAYDILSFDGKIWWPLRDGSEPLSVGAFMRSIGNPNGFFLATLNLSPATRDLNRRVSKSRFDADLSVREEEVSSRDQRWALAHRSASRLLFSDGAVYQEGSAPAYFGTWRTAAEVSTLDFSESRTLVAWILDQQPITQHLVLFRTKARRQNLKAKRTFSHRRSFFDYWANAFFSQHQARLVDFLDGKHERPLESAPPAIRGNSMTPAEYFKGDVDA